MTTAKIIVLTAGATTGIASAQALFTEDFEGLTLGPFVTEPNGDGTDWTPDLPAGWSRDNGSTPSDGPPEFFGFNAFDKNSWIAAAGDQDRSSFTRGRGAVLVADADEYDDSGSGIEPDLFNVFAQTPSISLDGMAADTVRVKFDSSFRPYDTMTGLVDVSFDGGATWNNLLTLDTASTPGGSSSLDRADEAISLATNNPAGGDMIVRFGMTDGGNDWWWAIDNVVVTPSPAGIALAGLGAIGLAGRGRRS